MTHQERGSVDGDPDRKTWKRLAALLDRLLDLPPEEADRELARLPPDAVDLRPRLEAALRVAHSGDAFLGDSAAVRFRGLLSHPIGTVASDLEAGEELGNWRLGEELGRGGMGVVYAAERADGSYLQRAAVKLLRVGLDDDTLRARFLRERQILARLEHPAIARLLDGGVAPDGRPFLVLERVDGQPLLAWCDDRRLDVAARLRLFLGVLDAVDHAHRNLIVHRDLKPSNVLVSESGQVKLLDFGVAKLLDSEGENDATRIPAPLTPQYAAPEQIAGGPITTSTDIYALGLILFELLTGSRPYRVEGESALELERRIVDTRPRPPSIAARAGPGAAAARGSTADRLARRLAGDLDAIVLRTLAKEPERRYPSVGALRDDLENHLEGRPVTARRDSLLYRVRCLVRRHRAASVATGLLLLAIATSFVALSFALAQARSRLAAGRRAEASLDFLTQVFADVDPERSGDHQITVLELLDRADGRLDELRDQPEIRVALTVTLADIYRALAAYDRATPLVERALTEIEEIAGEDRLQEASALAVQGALLFDQDLYREAEEPLRRAMAIHCTTDSDSRAACGESRRVLASCLRELGRYDEAESLGRTVLAADLAEHGDDDPRLAADLSGLAVTLWRMGRYEEAETLLRRSLAIRRRRLGETHPEVSDSLLLLGTVLHERGDHAEAEALLTEALAIRRRAYGPAHPSTAAVLTNLAALYDDAGRLEEAVAAQRQALEIRRRHQGPDRTEFAIPLNNLGVLAVRAGDFPEAELSFREVVQIWRREVGTDHAYTATALQNLAFALYEQGGLEEAGALAGEALRIRESLFGRNSSEVSQSLRLLGLIALLDGDPAGARRRLTEADTIARAVYEPDHPRLAEVAMARAELELAAGRSAEAEPLAREARDLLLAKIGGEAPQAADARHLLGRTLVALDRTEEARSELAEARRVLVAAFGESSWRPAEVDLALAELAFAEGDEKAARELLAGAHQSLEKAGRGTRGRSAERLERVAAVFGSER